MVVILATFSCDDTKNIVCSKPDHVMYDIQCSPVLFSFSQMMMQLME